MATTLKVLPRRKIRDVVAERLKSFIVSEGLETGDRLPTETELAASFGVSRLSLREATKSLEFLGIVESRTGVGLTVGQIDLDRMTDHLGFHPALHRAEPLQLIDSRIIIETGVLPHVARRMGEDESLYPLLQKIVDRFGTARKLQTWIDLDIEFHRALIETSGLAPLVAFGDLLQVFFRRFRDSVKMAEWKAGMASHQRIIDDLRDQNVERATSELRSHIESHKQRVLK
ncbi:MAG: GntR family transcriptional regulator [Planctomycetota bacterium]|nr:GntR family transcriptional regulator [Planctomycetota bacterium]MDA1252591.1 GntR family transcriptional regulator [Planctomycetota bacterium]